MTVVDTGLPRSWGSLHRALNELGRSPADIEAGVLTHGHFDHMGFARRARRELGVPLWAHERELGVVAHPWRYDHERPRAPYLRHPEFVRIFTEMTPTAPSGSRAPKMSAPTPPGSASTCPAAPRSCSRPATHTATAR